MTMQTRAFTLIDMLLVILCVTILIALLACIEPRTDLLGEQAECRANLSGIGKGIALYAAEDKNAKFPLLFTSGRPESNIKSSDSAKDLSELTTKLTGREATMQNVWKMIDRGLIPEEAFGCPADEDYAPRELESPADRKAHRVGWRSSANFSYGMHCPYKTIITAEKTAINPVPLGPKLKSSFVIMADKNPARTNEPATGVNPSIAPSNHRDGEIYLTYSGRVEWKRSSEDSQVNGDDIYTTQTQNKAAPEIPANLNDQYITRHPIDE
ncbi:MAG: hypothetical protein HN350_04865 [Phycisphaerales bacterium]|jgi:competence protein ComGC|nr:hypothetical protein [Phycisphaerales bacterium]